MRRREGAPRAAAGFERDHRARPRRAAERSSGRAAPTRRATASTAGWRALLASRARRRGARAAQDPLRYPGALTLHADGGARRGHAPASSPPPQRSRCAASACTRSRSRASAAGARPLPDRSPRRAADRGRGAARHAAGRRRAAQQFTHLVPLAEPPRRCARSRSSSTRCWPPRPAGRHAVAAVGAQGLRELARLLGASPFLWEDFLRREAEHLLPVLDSWSSARCAGATSSCRTSRARLAGRHVLRGEAVRGAAC